MYVCAVSTWVSHGGGGRKTSDALSQFKTKHTLGKLVVKHRKGFQCCPRFVEELSGCSVQNAKKHGFVCALQTLEDVTGDEFVSFMRMLSVMPTMATMQGRKELVEIVEKQVELDETFDVSIHVPVPLVIYPVSSCTPLSGWGTMYS